MERSTNDDDSANDDASVSIEELMSHFSTSPQQEKLDQSESSMICFGSLCSSKDTLHKSTVIAISPHELCRRMIKQQQREAQRTQAVKMRINDDMPTLEEYISKTRPPENDSNRRTGHQRSQSALFVSDTATANRPRPRSNSVGEISENYTGSTLSSHPSGHPYSRENESVSLFEDSTQKMDTTQQIRPSDMDFIGDETRSQSELFAMQLELDFLGEERNRSIERSYSELFERSTTSMLFEDIAQNDLIADERNQSIRLQRSQSEPFARDTPTTNRCRRSNSVEPALFSLDKTTTNRRRRSKSASVLSSHPTRGNESISICEDTNSPCLKHEHDAQGHKNKKQHIRVGHSAARKTTRDKECRGSFRKERSAQKLKKVVAESWKAEDNNLAGESRRRSSKIRSRNVKRCKSDHRSRRSRKSSIDEKRKEWSRSKSKVGDNSNESKVISTETSGTSLETGCPVADEELDFHVASRARKLSDDLNAQSTGSSLPTIWNDDTGFTGANNCSSDSDGHESDLSPHASSRVRKLSDLDAHMLYSEPRFSPNRKGSKDVFDEGLGFTTTEHDSSDYEDDHRMSERAQDSGVIIQFNANQEGFISRIRPDMAKASWLQIQHGDEELIECHIFRMPTPDIYAQETTPNPADERPVLNTKSSHRTSVRGFLFRSQKSVRKQWVEGMAVPEPSVALSKMESQAHFDKLGRSEFAPYSERT